MTLRTFFPRMSSAAIIGSLIALPAFALMRVTPAVVELQLENNRSSGSFVVANTDNAEIRLRATPVHFRLNEDGQLERAEPDSFAIVSWLKINPREFVLAPQSERQVRYTVIAPDTAADGSYWGAVEFHPVPSRADSEAAKSQVRAVTAIVVPMMVDKGQPTYRWSLDPSLMRSEITPRGVYLATPVKNDGNGRIPQTGVYEIRNSEGIVVKTGETNRLSVFPHSMRWLRTHAPEDLPPGSYEYAVTYTSEMDGRSLTGKLRFNVPDELPDDPGRN